MIGKPARCFRVRLKTHTRDYGKIQTDFEQTCSRVSRLKICRRNLRLPTRPAFHQAPAKQPNDFRVPASSYRSALSPHTNEAHRRNHGRRREHREPRGRASARPQRRPLHHVPHQVRGHLGDVQEGRGFVLDGCATNPSPFAFSRVSAPRIVLAAPYRALPRRVGNPGNLTIRTLPRFLSQPRRSTSATT